MTKRILALAFIIFSIITLPYWVYLPLILAAIIVFPLFWEAVALGFFIDALYGQKVAGLPSFISLYALLALVCVIALIPVRHRLRLHV